MADMFEAKTIDEELAGLVDEYDRFIAPRRIWRNNNNKLYLVFRAIAAGFSKIRDIVLASKYRFDPRYCSNDDLESAMLITGETRIDGKASIVRIICANSTGASATLIAGEYTFTSSDGQPFLFTVPQSIQIAGGNFEVMLFASRDKGAWPVDSETGASVTRVDNAPIDGAFVWETLENSASLGRPEESYADIRARILNDTTRQDSIRELELAISALPSIYLCNLIFNPSPDEQAVLEDGTVLEPKTLLILITGTPSPDMAALVMSHTIYKTHMVEADNVMNYVNPIFVGGFYPVYYAYHRQKQFYMTINYAYDPDKMRTEDIEATINTTYNRYKVMTQHLDEINEPLLYADIADHGIPGVRIKKIYIQEMTNGELASVAQVAIPRLALPQLVDINYVAEKEVIDSGVHDWQHE